jgi:hypothetical protein
MDNQVKSIKDSALGEEIDLYEGFGPKVALEDVLSVLGYFYK